MFSTEWEEIWKNRLFIALSSFVEYLLERIKRTFENKVTFSRFSPFSLVPAGKNKFHFRALWHRWTWKQHLTFCFELLGCGLIHYTCIWVWFQSNFESINGSIIGRNGKIIFKKICSQSPIKLSSDKYPLKRVLFWWGDEKYQKVFNTSRYFLWSCLKVIDRSKLERLNDEIRTGNEK